jgi:DNA processing protein
MAVPGPVTSAQSEGVHQLVRNGAASIVTRGEEVLELVGASGQHLLQPRRGHTRRRDLLPPRDQQVLEAVPLGRGVGAPSIARAAGVNLLDVRSALERLRKRGLVEGPPDGWRIRRGNGCDSAADSPEIPTMDS